MQREQSLLMQRLEPFEDSLRLIKRRWYYLTAMQVELDRVSRGKTFCIMNSIAWQMAFDSNHMLVIELASWVKRLDEGGGLFGLLMSRLNELERKFPKKRIRRVRDDDFLSKYDTEAHEEAVYRLFPAATGKIAKEADVEELRKGLRADCQRLVDDRNCNRAHPFEVPQGSAIRVGLPDIGALFEKLESVLSDVRLISDWTSTSFNDLNSTSAESAAEDFVDAVLIGTAGRRDLVMGGLLRDDYYERLHAMHDGGQTPKPGAFFNECEVEPFDQAGQRVVAAHQRARELGEKGRPPSS